MRTVSAPFALAALALLTQASLAQTTEQRSTLADQQEVAVTIYNENLALVKCSLYFSGNSNDQTLTSLRSQVALGLNLHCG